MRPTSEASPSARTPEPRPPPPEDLAPRLVTPSSLVPWLSRPRTARDQEDIILKTNVIRSAALAMCLSIGLGACNADQMRLWFDMKGIDHSTMASTDVEWWAWASTNYWNAALAPPPPPPPAAPAFIDKFAHVLSDAQLSRLRQCESGGNYGAVSSSGTYRGAYQFSRSTWNSVAGQHYPEWKGVDPAAAPPHVQDAMTRALWSQLGRKPWPHCGLRV